VKGRRGRKQVGCPLWTRLRAGWMHGPTERIRPPVLHPVRKRAQAEDEDVLTVAFNRAIVLIAAKEGQGREPDTRRRRRADG